MPARFGLLWADGVEAVTHDAADLTEGFWVVVQTFEGHLTALRMAHHGHDELAARPAPWAPLEGEWRTTLDSAAYRSGVREIRERIAAGTLRLHGWWFDLDSGDLWATDRGTPGGTGPLMPAT